MMDSQLTEIHALLSEAYAGSEDASPDARFRSLNLTLRRKKLWPALELKRFRGDDANLALLHNSYHRDDVAHFQTLYDACRSVVLDLTTGVPDSVVVSFAQPTPSRMDADAYEHHQQFDDVCEEAFQGTLVSAYYHKDKWHFGTTSCPSVDDSRYFSPTRSHGDMLDEAFERRGYADRHAFAAAELSANEAYTFLLVHHENSHLLDQASQLDDVPNYAAVFHLTTIDRASNVARRATCAELPLLYPRALGGPADALRWLRSAHAYGFVAIRADGSMVKVSMPDVARDEQIHLGSYNAWHNMLHAYLKATPDAPIAAYVERRYPHLLTMRGGGEAPPPGILLHRAVSAVCARMAELYDATTDWDADARRYSVRADIDGALAPMWRFHLAQLRGLQRAFNHRKKLGRREITAYVRYHVTLKNV